LWRGSPGPPTAPLGAGQLTPVCPVLLSVGCLLACGVVPRTPSPGWGRQLATLLPLWVHRPIIILQYSGLRPASSLTLWGADETPPPPLPDMFISSAGCGRCHSQPSGAIVNQAPPPPHYYVGPPSSPTGPSLKSPTHPGGGRGAGPALPYPPHPPPLPAAWDLGGGTHQAGSPLFLSWWRGSLGPPPPRLGLAVSILALPLTNPLLSSASSTCLNHDLTPGAPLRSYSPLTRDNSLQAPSQ